MKKILIGAMVFALAASAASAQVFSLKISGGYGSSSLGDLATGIQGVSDFLKQEYGATETFLAPKKGVAFGGELVVRPWSFLGLGIGAGFLDSVKESLVSYAVGAVAVTETIKPSLKVIPVTLNLHLYIPIASFLRLDLSGGAGYYFTTLDWDDQMNAVLASQKGEDHYTFSGKKAGLGYQAGIGIEVGISPRLWVVLGASGRWAKIGPFQGAWTDTFSGDFGSGNLSGSDDVLWAFDRLAGGTTFPQIAFQAEAPGGGHWISNARQAKIDISGFAVSLGLKYAFGR